MTYHGTEMESIHPPTYPAMTWEDAERMEERNQKNGWGFKLTDCLYLFGHHKDAWDFICESNNYRKNLVAEREMDMIEWRLDDANFHTFKDYLHDHDYEKALKWIINEYTEMEVQ